MATPPRRWPTELEQEREQTLHEATTAAAYLLKAQRMTDEARSKFNSNVNLATVQLSEVERSTFDALACLERIQRNLAVCKGKEIDGRWPIVATRQRDDSLQAAQTATDELIKAQDTIARAVTRLPTNASLVETMAIDIARSQARALMLAERIARLMTEAAIGRD
jgi:hypothetical protein